MWVSVQILFLVFFSAKLKCQILLQGIFDAINFVIYHAVTIEKSEKKFLKSVSRFVIKIVLDLLKWLKKTIFYEEKKEIRKTQTFAEKESSF